MYRLPENGFIYIIGKIESFISFFLSQIPDRKIVFFYDNEDEALLLKEETEFFSKKEVFYFPIYSHRIFEREDESKRMSFLYHLATDPGFIGLFPHAALDHPLFPPGLLMERSFEVEFGQTLLQEEFIDYLYKAGYEPVPLVREQGEYAKRGAIVDIFPPSSANPVRIELLGDQVYSLRYFDPGSQRSQAEIERSFLVPARLSPDKEVTILDYLPDTAVVIHKGIDELCRKFEENGQPGGGRPAREKILSLLNVDISGVRGNEEGRGPRSSFQPGPSGSFSDKEDGDLHLPHGEAEERMVGPSIRLFLRPEQTSGRAAAGNPTEL